MKNHIQWSLAILIAFLCVGSAAADTVSFSGAITQSTADGTGVYDPTTGNYEAVNNPSLNAIQDGDAYTVTLNFTGSVTAPGMFDLTGATLAFSDPTAPATETAFDSINFTVAADGLSDDLSLLGCLTSGSSCAVGNELSAYFSIPAVDLNQQNVPATVTPGLYPSLNLLEDDGQTDIQATVTTYSYSPPGSVTAPEPASLTLLLCGLLMLSLGRIRRQATGSVLGS